MTVQPLRTASVASHVKDDMFCMQCEQTRDGVGCSTVGVCGKTPEVSAMQDLLLDKLKSIGFHAHRARALGVPDNEEVNRFPLDALFSTLTNVNFDPKRFQTFIHEADRLRHVAQTMHMQAAARQGHWVDNVDWPCIAAPPTPFSELEQMVAEGRHVSVPRRFASGGNDEALSLAELAVYGLKGTAAYAHHAMQLGRTSPAVAAFMHEALSQLANPHPAAGEMLKLALDVGRVNVDVMAMLDEAHTSRFGHPTPAAVRTQPRAGKCILVSGHDLNDLHDILVQTEGKGVDVYTHGEMLPAHGYPQLRKFKHLAGNYGSAWQNQKFEFSEFPGPIVMTTNCLIEPMTMYKNRLFTRSVVGWPGVRHIANNDYSEVVQAALHEEGFDETLPAKEITVGFGHNTVIGVADKVLGAVKSGALRHVFFIGGCDGSEGERNYFKELAMAVPKDCLILTAGCGKYRFNKQQFGTLADTGIPRLLDVGQCNDSFGVVKIASALAGALNCGINDLPVSLAVSWFEQKAVAVLLSLLHLGVKNIHLGPKLPAFVTPSALQMLSEQYGLRKTGVAREDLQAMLGRGGGSA